jgi:hypothetical protein
MTMSCKNKLAALAAVLTVVSVHGTASAKAFSPAPKYQSYKAVNRSKAKMPSNAFGSAGDRTSTSHLAQPVFGWEGAYKYQPSSRPASDFQHRGNDGYQHRDYDGYQRDRQLVGDRGGQATDASNGGGTGPSE